MWLRHAAQTLLGIALAVTPVVLWVAWTPLMLACVLGFAVICAALLVLLTEPAAHGSEDPARLSDDFLREVQRLHPMIHHHSPRRSARFHRIMQSLMQLAMRTGR